MGSNSDCTYSDGSDSKKIADGSKRKPNVWMMWGLTTQVGIRTILHETEGRVLGGWDPNECGQAPCITQTFWFSFYAMVL